MSSEYMLEISRLQQRINELEYALCELLNDSQHMDHSCGDDQWCPVLNGHRILRKNKDYEDYDEYGNEVII